MAGANGGRRGPAPRRLGVAAAATGALLSHLRTQAGICAGGDAVLASARD
jgi:hypothetical protein